MEADGPVWHFVTAGDPADEVVLMVHGYPDTWWANAEVMALLSDEYYVIAVDVLGYGQSDKGPEIDVSYAGAAGSLVALLDKIGVKAFNLISHDRGTIVSENLLAIDDMSNRVSAYVRMQQSFDKPHGLPRPPHAAMASVEFQSQENLAGTAYSSNYGSVHFPERFLQRLNWEFGFPGTPEAAARTFQGTSFDIELAFRMENVIPKMTMPVLLVQGTDDPGQKAEEYMTSAESAARCPCCLGRGEPLPARRRSPHGGGPCPRAFHQRQCQPTRHGLLAPGELPVSREELRSPMPYVFMALRVLVTVIFVAHAAARN
ncbi:alpha/beta hydrolase [Yoonia sp. GPGPB17]|uniref:alpha/beta fold hydrolase n=1 Tax=Yoonia sp. GPGPB17 TaxID=3026147 RepID=UPI0030C0F402